MPGVRRRAPRDRERRPDRGFPRGTAREDGRRRGRGARTPADRTRARRWDVLPTVAHRVVVRRRPRARIPAPTLGSRLRRTVCDIVRGMTTHRAELDALAAAGVYDASAPAADERLELLQWLLDRDITVDQIVAADRRGSLYR